MESPTIQVLCFFYNEETLARLFLRHYAYADNIHAVVSRSTDRTLEVLQSAPNVTIEPFEFPMGMDDILKTEKVNAWLAARSEFDWQIVVDADEFVWPSLHNCYFNDEFIGKIVNGFRTKEYLRGIPPEVSVLWAKMKNVFRHETEADLDLNLPPALQRRHGDPNQYSAGNAQYCKPVIIRANQCVRLGLGNHELTSGHPPGEAQWFEGAHWQNADPAFALTRRLRDRRDRQSQRNRQLGLGQQHHHIREEDVLRVCQANRSCPQLF